MPKRYQREAIEKAYAFYLQGFDAQEIARRMQAEGYPSFAPATLNSRQPDRKGRPKGWIHRYGWEESRAKAQAARMDVQAAPDLEDHILADYTQIRVRLVEKVKATTIDRDDMQLLLKVDDLILSIERAKRGRDQARDRLREARDALEELVAYLKQVGDKDALIAIQDHLEGFTEHVRRKFAA